MRTRGYPPEVWNWYRDQYIRGKCTLTQLHALYCERKQAKWGVCPSYKQVEKRCAKERWALGRQAYRDSQAKKPGATARPTTVIRSYMEPKTPGIVQGIVSQYKPEYAKALVAWIDRYEGVREERVTIRTKSGQTKEAMERRPVPPPVFGLFLKEHPEIAHVARSVFHSWRENQEDWAQAFDYYKDRYKEICIMNAATGLYNAYFTQGLLFNEFGWKLRPEEKGPKFQTKKNHGKLTREERQDRILRHAELLRAQIRQVNAPEAQAS